MAEETLKKAYKDEDPVGKVYDSRLMRRLAHYLRPYWLQAIVSSLAVSLKAISDVTGPYLVKVAIDRYLTGTPGPATNWFTRRLPADPWQGVTRLAAIYLGRTALRLSLRVHPDLPHAVDRPEDHVRSPPATSSATCSACTSASLISMPSVASSPASPPT